MRVLVLSAYFEPEIAASLYLYSNLYEDMAQSGCDVIVYTPVPTRGVDDETRRRFKNKRIEHQVNGKLTIHRVAMFREGTNPILRAIRYALLSLVLLWKGLFIKADVIFVQSTPPTQGALGAILKAIKKVPLIYNVQDIFPESLVVAGLTRPSSILWQLGRVVAQFAYKHADMIIVISEGFRQSLLSNGVREEKIVVIPNWVEESVVTPLARAENKLFSKYHLNPDKFYVTHCGNIGLSQNMDLLIDVADDLKGHDGITFLLIGDGVYKKTVGQQIAERSLSNILLIPFQPYEDISHVFSLGDVGLVISKARVGQSSVPSKTFSIMSAARPVLASFDQDSELASLLQKQQCGVCVPPEDRGALKKAILNMYADRAASSAMGIRGRKYVADNLTRAKGTSQYIQVIRGAVPRTRALNGAVTSKGSKGVDT